MAKIKLSSQEIARLLDEEPASFEKYIAPILNLTNRFAGGTAAKVVGQMTDVIHQFQGNSLKEWEEWYLKEHPEAIENATRKIKEKLLSLKQAMDKIDQPTIERWVRDLVVVKTYIGLRFQEAILKRVSDLLRTSYTLASASEESRGIDGYIGGIPVSIKPDSYHLMQALPEHIGQKMIYYSKAKNGITVDYTEIEESFK